MAGSVAVRPNGVLRLYCVCSVEHVVRLQCSLPMCKEGITGSQLGVGGMDLIIIPLQALSPITLVLRLSTAAFLVLRSLVWSCTLVPSTNTVWLRSSCALDHRMSVFFPHSALMESHASFAVPVVTTPRPATSVQLRVICPRAS